MRLGLQVALVCLCAGAALPANAQVTRRVLVAPLQGDPSLNDEVLTGLHALFVEELDKLDHVDIQELNMRALQVVGVCVGKPSCLGRKLARLGATHFIMGRARRPEGGGFELQLSLHKTPRGEQINKVTQLIKGKGRELEKQARHAALSLLNPEDLTGLLSVTVNVRGADILVDGKRRGRSPLNGAIRNVLEGRRTVEVRKKGYQDFTADVDIELGEETPLDVRLVRSEKESFEPERLDRAKPLAVRVGRGRGLPVWAIVAGTGGSIATLLGGAFFMVVAGVLTGVTIFLVRALESRAAQQTLIFPDDLPLLWGWRISFGSMITAGVLTGVVLVAGAAATAAATGGLAAFHYTRPLPDNDASDFGQVRLQPRHRKADKDEGAKEEKPALEQAEPPRKAVKEPPRTTVDEADEEDEFEEAVDALPEGD